MTNVATLKTLLWQTFLFLFVETTIDINLAEFEYLASHLDAEECRKLVASLHFKSYNEPNALDQAERKISKDVTCLHLLLHWNSAEGEGKGETHEVLEHRLRQMGRYDLADWLGRTVFHQLGNDLNRNLEEPFKDFVNVTEKTHLYVPPTTLQLQTLEDVSEWTPFDTICYTLVCLLLIAIVLIFVKIIYVSCCGKSKKKRQKYSNKTQYNELENETSDSEDRFDIRKHSSSSTKPQGV